MLRHIAWFNEAPIEPDPNGGLRSDDEDVRNRCLLPAAELENSGVDCSVFGNLHDAKPSDVSKLLQKMETDIVVVGASSNECVFKLARTAKQLGCYIVADFANHSAISEAFKRLAEIADQIVASTTEAQTFLNTHHYDAKVVPDNNAGAWLDCFKSLKLKPPACANSNTPPA